MNEVKDAPRTKPGNGQGQTKEVVRQTPAGVQKVEANRFEFLKRLAQEMDRVFEDFSHESGWHLPRFLTRGRKLFRHGAGTMGTAWSPGIDVLETEGQFMVRADLPGMTKDDVKVGVSEGLLTIEGERKEQKEEEHEGYHYSECRYGSFYRVVPLPDGVDESKATADFRKGVLEVTMPMAARRELKARQIEVRDAK